MMSNYVSAACPLIQRGLFTDFYPEGRQTGKRAGGPAGTCRSIVPEHSRQSDQGRVAQGLWVRECCSLEGKDLVRVLLSCLYMGEDTVSSTLSVHVLFYILDFSQDRTWNHEIKYETVISSSLQYWKLVPRSHKALFIIYEWKQIALIMCN